jgi:hypothetical protein
MSAHTIAFQMPEPLYLRLQRLAALTHRSVESLVLQALDAQIPLLLEDMPAPLRSDLSALETLEDMTLQQVAQGVWSSARQIQYTALLDKERANTLTPSEKAALEALYQEANGHMLQKAYANALLKWRGHLLPTLAELEAAP